VLHAPPILCSRIWSFSKMQWEVIYNWSLYRCLVTAVSERQSKRDETLLRSHFENMCTSYRLSQVCTMSHPSGICWKFDMSFACCIGPIGTKNVTWILSV
jgi:hypothetical protein